MTATQEASHQASKTPTTESPNGRLGGASPVKGVTPNIEVAPVQRRPRNPAPWPLDLYQSAVGKKWVMALSGVGLMGFVFAHMVGNLKMFIPDDGKEFDDYSESLRTLLYPILPNTTFLWIMRIGLICLFAIHLHSAYSLTILNRRARPQQYSQRDYIAASWAARTMRFSGILVIAYLFIHLANLTWGVQALDDHRFVDGRAFHNTVTSLSQPWLAAIYIIRNLALAVHLFHGAWSLFQSLGVNNPRLNPWRKGFAYGFTAIVCGFNISFPILILAGVVTQVPR